MNYSNFWTLVKKDPDKPLPGPVLQLDATSILEITEDGMAFLWPIEPDRGELCLYCRNHRSVTPSVFSSKLYHDIRCRAPENATIPCNFIAVEDPEHQDLDSYLLDGDCKDAGGYFLGLKQFLEGHDYSEDDLNIFPLGSHIGIASARAAWSMAQLTLPMPYQGVLRLT